jgi:hypothetical protein
LSPYELEVADCPRKGFTRAHADIIQPAELRRNSGPPTGRSNLVLLCHHHHGIVEPAKHGTRDQWEVRIAPDGVAEFIPPARLDPQRRLIRHARFAASAGRGEESMPEPQTAA